MRVLVRSISAGFFSLTFAAVAAKAAQDDWLTYRHDSARTGAQPIASDLANPFKILGLHIIAQFPLDPPAPAPGGFAVPGGFTASPIVVDGTAFIGDVNGYFYAFDAASGKYKWQYPKAGAPLRGSCGPLHAAGNYSFGQYGIRTGATFAFIGNQPAVIFGAPDPDHQTDNGFGSARLFALPLSPADPHDPKPIWKSDVVAHVTGCSVCLQTDDHSSPTCKEAYGEKHERIAYSSPLVLNDKVYVGIHDSGDSPIQQGRVVAVDLNTGHLLSRDAGNPDAFQFLGAGNALYDGKLGGSVWNALATDGTGVFFTTGNTHDPWCQLLPAPKYIACSNEPEPQPNNGLSMIRVDKDTGNIVWKYQPVPFQMDADPDWAAGATVMRTSCGELIASVQKDGWSYAIDANQPNRAPSCPLTGHSWQFPDTTSGCQFWDPQQQHGDTDYRRPGAAWNDVFIVRTGGENLVVDGFAANYSNLHALNACAVSEQDRVRWIAEIPNKASQDGHVSYSSPTVTGGIVFIGTNQNPNDPIDNAGQLVVLADPSIVPATQQVCSNADYDVSDCTGRVMAPVWKLKPLLDIKMWDNGSLASMRNEPVLAEGRVYVATHPREDNPGGSGHVYILAPGGPDSVPTIIENVITIIE